jgi:hypothetical protein
MRQWMLCWRAFANITAHPNKRSFSHSVYLPLLNEQNAHLFLFDSLLFRHLTGIIQGLKIESATDIS